MQSTSTGKRSKADKTPTSDRKRKLSSDRPSGALCVPTDNASIANAKQQTISELFSNSKQKAATGGPTTPKNKRARLCSIDRSLDDLPSSPPTTSQEALSPANMYSFSSRNSLKDTIVDLTGSPTSSPRKIGIKNGARASNNPHAGPRRIVVKNFKTQSKADPKQYFDQVWNTLDAALGRIFAGQKIAISYEELYKSVENVCRQGHAEALSYRLYKRCELHMNETVYARLLEQSHQTNTDVLRAVLAAWATWKANMKQVEMIWCYMDRSYLLPKGRSLESDSHGIFRTKIFHSPKFQEKVVDGACDLIREERDSEGGSMDANTFENAISMFHEISVYTDCFEPRLLELSQTFIIQWAAKMSSEVKLAEYVSRSIRLIEREARRCDRFNLDSSTKRNLMTLLEDQLVTEQESKLVDNDAVADLLDQNAIEDLKQLFSFLQKRSLGEKLMPAFVAWVDLTGTAIVFDEKEQDQMVVKLLCMKQQLDHIWKYSFERNDELGHAMRKTFESFINKTRKTNAAWGTDNSKPEEMIAKYLDLLLRGGSKAIPAMLSKSAPRAQRDDEDNEEQIFDEDSEVNNQLDQVLDLFRFVHGKAVFEAFYKKDLARRLLMGRSASADAERSMLSRLQTECGSGFTYNLEQMFKDIELSREELASYKTISQEREGGKKERIDLSVNVLSQAAWPTYPEIPVRIPMEIKTAIDKFEKHYKTKHSNKKLEWKHALANCQLRADFPKGRKELVVSSFQAIVLLQFNDRAIDERLSYDFLKVETGLPDAELKRTLQSLACARLRPLSKQPKGREIDETDTFTINASFTDPKARVKINTVQLKETAAENKETHERVHADRQFECQAAIVRILKSKKVIGYQDLIAETISATAKRGAMSVADIKKNLDRLIEKEYCERADDGELHYLA
ncbi:Cullin-domain-containing protein [Pseudovirgaria hyperparasitica]|uniref:Cullin-domain-containing protein n=1 Tax=Pseudovirgaria hyperparasitica TaxID=470096 RepID=A0A6A6WKW0_9PEZI|nr:Cullin-domain-containing protein [Pseudovirgaria hyperparasitica]KAF2762840.1 Cullin-domain-containing protein [Pseudovirgaria hyperparasitica]